MRHAFGKRFTLTLLVGLAIAQGATPAQAVPRINADQPLNFMSAHLGEWVWNATKPHPHGLLLASSFSAHGLNPAIHTAANANHDARLTHAEFDHWMAVVKTSAGLAVWRSQLAEAFSIEDRDHDGVLNLTDLQGRGVPSPMIHGLPLFPIQWLSTSRSDFSSSDNPADGTLSPREYEDLFVKTVRGKLRAH